MHKFQNIPGNKSTEFVPEVVSKNLILIVKVSTSGNSSAGGAICNLFVTFGAFHRIAQFKGIRQLLSITISVDVPPTYNMELLNVGESKVCTARIIHNFRQ